MHQGSPESRALRSGEPSLSSVRHRPEASVSGSGDDPRQRTVFEPDDARSVPTGDGGSDGASRDDRTGEERDRTGEERVDGPAASESEAGVEGGSDQRSAGDPPPPSADRGEAERLFERAKAAWLEGRTDDAMSRYRELVAMDPGHVRARNNLGVLLDRTGASEVALEHFQAALEVEPENPEVLTNYGAALAALGRYDEAEIQLRRAMRIEPGRIDVRANLGILYFRRGLYAQSEHELRWVCEQDPDHSAAHFYRGEALNRLGRVDDALEVLERASHLQPDNPRVYYLLGILYDKKHLRQEAGLMYRKARELSDR